MPPCDLNSFHEPICNNYVCRRVEPRGKECVFVGNCNGDEKCIATAQYLGVSATDYYGDSSTFDESNSGEQYQAEASEVSDSYSTSTSGSDPTASVERSWWPYALLGGVLAAFIALTAWRRRVSAISRLKDKCQIEIELTHPMFTIRLTSTESHCTRCSIRRTCSQGNQSHQGTSCG